MLAMLAAPAALASPCAHAMRLFNPCLDAELPAPLASHELVERALDGIDPAKFVETFMSICSASAADRTAAPGSGTRCCG